MWMLILVFLSGTPSQLSIDDVQKVVVEAEDERAAARLCFMEEKRQVSYYSMQGVIVASRCVPLEYLGEPA